MKGIVQGGKKCGSFESPDLYVSISEQDIRTWIDKIVAGEETVIDKCFQNQVCVPRDQCEYIRRLYNKFEDLETTEKGKEITKHRLQSKICNRENKHFCCASPTFNTNNVATTTQTHTDKGKTNINTSRPGLH